jgi:hypothetical protein
MNKIVLLIAISTIIIVSILVAVYKSTFFPNQDSIYLIDSYQTLDLNTGNKTTQFVWGFNSSSVNLERVEVAYNDETTTRDSWNMSIHTVFEVGDTLNLTLQTANLVLRDDGQFTFNFYIKNGGFQLVFPTPTNKPVTIALTRLPQSTRTMAR